MIKVRLAFESTIKMIILILFSWMFLIIVLMEFECLLGTLFRFNCKAFRRLWFRVTDASVFQLTVNENSSN